MRLSFDCILYRYSIKIVKYCFRNIINRLYEIKYDDEEEIEFTKWNRTYGKPRLE